MQIIRTLGELGYSDRELASHFIISSVFQVEPTRGGDEVHQSIILIRIEACLQIERVLSVFVSQVQDSGIKGILLLDAILTPGRVFHLTSGTIEVEYPIRCLPNTL